MLAGEGFFVGLVVAGGDGLVDQVRMYALLLEVLANAPLAHLLVFMAEAGVGFGEGLVVEKAVLFEADDYRRNDCIAVFAGFDAVPAREAIGGLHAGHVTKGNQDHPR